MESCSFATEAIRMYQAERLRISDQYRSRGKAPLLGQPLAVALFNDSIGRTADRYGEIGTPSSPYSVVYSHYTRQCMVIVWDGTLSKLSQYFEAYLRETKSSFPKGVETRRKMARECIGQKAYFAVLYAVGGHLEVDLVLDSIIESAYRSVPADQRYRNKVSSPKKRAKRPAVAKKATAESPPATVVAALSTPTTAVRRPEQLTLPFL